MGRVVDLRGRWFGTVFLAVLALLLPALAFPNLASAAVQVSQPAPWQSGDPQFSAPQATLPIMGVNYHGIWSDLSDADRQVYLDKLAAGGVEWVRLDISWAMVQPSGPNSYDMGWGVPRIDKRIEEIAARGMKTLMLFYQTPAWASDAGTLNATPRNPEQFADAAAWVAARYGNKLAAMEIWNEPDLADFLASKSPTDYTNLVKAAYPKVKAANPNLTVVAGAPTYTNTNWYSQFFAKGGADHYDALGIHPYMGNSDEPPTACNTKYIQYYPCNIPNLIQLMRDNGDGDKKIWATEYGWSSHDNSTYSQPVPTWKRGVTEQQQADYLLGMQQVLAQWPEVEASFWYNGRNKNHSDAQEANYGLLKRDFTPKPAYYALKCANTNICNGNDAIQDTPSGSTQPVPGSVNGPNETTSRVKIRARATVKATARVKARISGDMIRVKASAKRKATVTLRAQGTTKKALRKDTKDRARLKAQQKAIRKAKGAARQKLQHRLRRADGRAATRTSIHVRVR